MDSLRPILCVDDNEDHLALFERTFENHYDTHSARSGHEALEILRQRDIHLILSDQRMPGMTGVQLFEAIQEEYPDPVRMILTSYADVDAIIRAINAGRIYRFISKPWDEKQLKVILDRALESYDLEMRNRRLEARLRERVAREERIRKIFQRYVPAAVVNELLDTRQKDHFLGERRVVAALYFDIHGFTRLSARLKPEEVMFFLNHYYTSINRIVRRHSGTIKDGKLAVFGAPISSLNNAENAVRAAVEMVAAVAEFNRNEAAEMVGEDIRFGIGINLGDVVAGNIGSEEKMEYSVIGDTVNTAARIYELTHDGSDSILLSQSVLDQVGGLVGVESLESVQLRGRAELTRLYRVMLERA